jgi:hypothetical protein
MHRRGTFKMPGGNSSIIQSPFSLDSFLLRKRKPLSIWLIENGITSELSLQALLGGANWSVSQELVETIRRTFIMPVEPPEPIPTVIAELEVVPMVDDNVVEAITAIDEQTSFESALDEPMRFVDDDSSPVVIPQQNKEKRKYK